MKSFAVASLFLAATAVAQPHGHQHRRHHEQHEKRELVTEIEWVTETAFVTKLVDSTTTVWVSPGSEATSTSEQAQFVQSAKAKKQSSSTTFLTSTSSSSVYVPPSTTTTSSTTTSSSSVYVAAAETSTSLVEEEPTTSEYVAPTTTSTSTSVYVAPTTTSEEAAATTTASSSDDSDSSSGTVYSGDITYYDLGSNACGGSSAGEDYTSNIVALPYAMLNGNGPTLSTTPNCGRTITIKANGKTTTAKAVDKCMGCDGGAIDVSKKVFTYLWGSLDKGRGECEWWFSD